jgi:hypothetical protein
LAKIASPSAPAAAPADPDAEAALGGSSSSDASGASAFAATLRPPRLAILKTPVASVAVWLFASA